jgi:GTPase SAR1 family protein
VNVSLHAAHIICSVLIGCLLKVPVVLVGNKIDLRGGEVSNEALEDEILPIMNEFKVSRIFFLRRLLSLSVLNEP